MKSNVKSIIKRIIIIVSVLTASIICFTMVNEKPTFADSGFSTSHSSSSHSSSSHSSSSSRSRSSSSSRSSSGSGKISGSTSVGILFLVLFVILFIFIILKTTQKMSKLDIDKPIDPQSENNIENEIRKYIPDFNKQVFLGECYNIYCNVQVAWMNFTLENVRDVLSNELYTMYESQLQTLEVKGEQNIMKDFVLRGAYLNGLSVQNNTITITTRHIIEFYDYIADRQTGKTLRGNSRQKMHVVYEMTFRKNLNNAVKLDKCPNCGAPLDINTSGVCPYCRSNLVGENIKWVLTDKKAISQRYI